MFIVSAISQLYYQKMTTSSTQTNEQEDSTSQHTQDADWVMVKNEVHKTKGDFELIDAAEARCWCGGSDAERCRLRGHTWPLCTVDQGGFFSKGPDEIHSQPDEEDGTESSNSSGEQSAGGESNADDSKGATRKTTPQSETHSPGFYESGPFTTLAVLTDILEKGRYTGT